MLFAIWFIDLEIVRFDMKNLFFFRVEQLRQINDCANVRCQYIIARSMSSMPTLKSTDIFDNVSVSNGLAPIILQTPPS